MAKPSAYITLLTDEAYLPGALVLAHSLKKEHKTKHRVATLIQKSAFLDDSLNLLQEVYDDLIEISAEDVISAPLAKLAEKLGREELSATYTKILLWNRHEYDMLLYLDSDTLPLKPLDHLFEQHSELSADQIVASPDAGWPDIFNSGVFLMKPSTLVFESLLDHSSLNGASFDGADQGLLNEYFNVSLKGSKWLRLPFLYNVTPSSSYQYVPAYERFFDQIHLMHFIGGVKPWHDFGYNPEQYSHLWWDAFNKHFSDPAVRSQVLVKKDYGANKMKFGKIENVWDSSEVAAEPSIDAPSEPQVPAVFPWESREYVAPTRVFNPATLPSRSENAEFDQQLADSSEAFEQMRVSNEKNGK